MDDEMNGPVSWVVRKMSLALEPDERDAVLGDLTEARTSSAESVRQVLGLVARRQVAAWTDLHAWLGLAGIAIPCGVFLSYVSLFWADGTAIYAFLYTNNWTWAYLETVGSRRELARHIGVFLINAAALACWAWSYGFVLILLSRRTAWLSLGILTALVFGASVGAATAGRNPSNAPVFAQTFYADILPQLFRTLLIIVPALFAVRRAYRRVPLSLVRATAGVGATVLLTAWTAAGLARNVTILPNGGGAEVAWVLLVTLWPCAYLLTTLNWRRAVT